MNLTLRVDEVYIHTFKKIRMTLREMMLERIESLKKLSGGFSKSTMRWQTFYGIGKEGVVNTHISEMDFDALNDDDLLFLFERILQRYYRQM